MQSTLRYEHKFYARAMFMLFVNNYIIDHFFVIIKPLETGLCFVQRITLPSQVA